MPPQTTAPTATPGTIISFVQGAHEHVETIARFTHDFASRVTMGPYDVPSYGYLRNVVIKITTLTAGTGAGVASPDYPWNIIQSVQLSDVNGAPIVGPIDGYALRWVNALHSTEFQPDPALKYGYSNDARSPSYTIRLPLEIDSSNGLGSLANQDSAAAYKVTIDLNDARTAWTTPGDTNPRIQVDVWGEFYTVPNAVDMLGNPQEQAPPGLGTAQYVTYNTQPVLAGQNTIQVKRVGNMIASHVVIFRDATGARAASVAFNPYTVAWDGRDMWQAVTPDYMLEMAQSRMNGSRIDPGVLINPFNTTTLSKLGNGPLKNLWPTTQSTRVEIRGTSAANGSIQIVTTDIALAQVNPSGRYLLNSATGDNPRMVQPGQG